MPTRVLISITVKPGTGDEFVDAYRIVRERVATVAGYWEEELLADQADPDRFLLLTLWDSRAAFLNWQQAPVHAEMTREMHPYFATRSEIHYYDLEVGRANAEVTSGA